MKKSLAYFKIKEIRPNLRSVRVVIYNECLNTTVAFAIRKIEVGS